jgi:hypothetical protein
VKTETVMYSPRIVGAWAGKGGTRQARVSEDEPLARVAHGGSQKAADGNWSSGLRTLARDCAIPPFQSFAFEAPPCASWAARSHAGFLRGSPGEAFAPSVALAAISSIRSEIFCHAAKV